MAWEPNVAVDTGSDPSTMDSLPKAADGTIIQDQFPGDLDSTLELQGPVPQKNPFEELNLFVGEIARLYAIPPRAAMVRIQDMLQAMLTQSYA